MFDWLFGPSDDQGYDQRYERWVEAMNQQNYYAGMQNMCCTYRCDLCNKQVRLGDHKIHTIGNFCAECYNFVGRVEKLMAQKRKKLEAEVEAASAASLKDEMWQENRQLKEHIARLQNMIVKMTQV